MPSQKKSPARLNSKFLNKVKIQNLIPQTELNFRILSRAKAFSKLISPAWELSRIQFPLESSFKIPSRAKTVNPQRNQISKHSPHRDTSHQIEDSQSHSSSMSLPGFYFPSRYRRNSHSPQVTKDFQSSAVILKSLNNWRSCSPSNQHSARISHPQ